MHKYAVFGHPVKHSKSPQIHTDFAEKTKQDLSYQAIQAPVDGFLSAIQDFIQSGGNGANVTMPFKLEAFELADSLSRRAELAGAVNTLTFHPDGTISGDNTDGQGLVDDLTRLIGSLNNKHILLIGAGGAARGVINPLFSAGVGSIVICNRTKEKAVQLGERFKSYGDIKGGDLSQASDHLVDIVINSTSSSMSKQLPEIDKSVFVGAELAYDMVYQDAETHFMQWALNTNSKIKTSDGLGMLVGQAAESFYIWRGIKPDIQSTLNKLR